jgi:trehalose 6-phosphate synthase/phosphatase
MGVRFLELFFGILPHVVFFLSLFQCRQCQDLLENNLARKRPIEVLVGKKNLEVRPFAVNKGEIVKRIVYKNPDAEFIFCAGDDKVPYSVFGLFSLH